MDPAQIEAALVQVLENFQRCGITRFGGSAANELPPGVLAKIEQLSHSQPSVSERLSSVPGGQRPQAKEPLAQGQRAELTQPPQNTGEGSPAPTGLHLPATPSSLVVNSAPWSLPILAPEERLQRFDSLAAQVRDCRKCSGIVTFRQQTVFGDGNLAPTICFMGEAPGADEDRTGKPFVGKAGQLLTKIITAMKLNREEVYILNALKCRPPQNRTPMPDEIEHCRHFVETQLEILQPKFIVCLGAVAVRSILCSDLSIGRLRGKFHQYRDARVVVTYHPSYLLRNESAKKLVWEDMKMLMAELPS